MIRASRLAHSYCNAEIAPDGRGRRSSLCGGYFGVSLRSLLVQGVLGLGFPVPLSVST